MAKFVTRKVHGNQGMKQLGLEIIREVSGREKVKRLEFMNKSLWEELRRMSKESFKKKRKKKKELKKFEKNFEKKLMKFYVLVQHMLTTYP